MRIQTTRIYEENAEAWLSGKRRALNEGGTASSKTWSILQLLILIAQHTKSPLLISVVSESSPHLKRGAIRDFFKILDESQDNNPRYNKTEKTYTFGKGVIEFFGADESDKVRGPRRDILFINEANNVPWETARGLDIRTNKFTFCDWNPVSEFWAHEYWMGQDENAFIHSTYKDAAEILPEEVVANIESNKDKDPNWWNIYGLGRIGKIEGLVYPLFNQVPELPRGEVFYGLDFGFSTDVTALIKNVIVSDSLYSQELIYERGLTNQDISHRMSELGVQKHSDEIFADSSEPKSIEEIYQYGFNIKPCTKGPGSVEYGHQKVRQFKQFWTEDSINCIKEQRNFRYLPDKNGKLTDKTSHIWSHCLIAGTLVTTMRGNIPIELVTVDDHVLTRGGWQKINASGMVSPSAKVQTVMLSNGTNITGTPNHKVYIQGKGFLPLNTLRYGDIIEVCPREKELNIMGSGITDTLNQRIGLIKATTGANRIMVKIDTSIDRYGLIPLGIYQKDMKSTTKKMSLIMILKTLFLYLKSGITCNTPSLCGNSSGYVNMPRKYVQRQSYGINQKKAGNGTGSMVEKFTRFGSHSLKSVINAGENSKILQGNQQLGFARMPVNLNGVEPQRLTMILECASIAEENSVPIDMLKQNFAPVHVLGVTGVHCEKQPVFDLTIEGLPEFYANGILVHNSMDARRYGVVGKAEPPGDVEKIIEYDTMVEVDMDLI